MAVLRVLTHLVALLKQQAPTIEWCHRVLQACSYLDAGFSMLKYLLLASIFVLITPIGIGAFALVPLCTCMLQHVSSDNGIPALNATRSLCGT